LSAKIVPTFAAKGCHVVSVTDPYGIILGFLDRTEAVIMALNLIINYPSIILDEEAQKRYTEYIMIRVVTATYGMKQNAKTLTSRVT
jgi:hypothetical protein